MSEQTAPARSSFYLAMRLLPQDQREAMFAIYRFCRAVDDVADEPQFGSRRERFAALERWRADIAATFVGRPPAELVDLAAATRRYDLQREDFEAVVAGVEMDVEADIRAPTWASLDLYCDRVASAVGRLSVRVFGLAGPSGDSLAFHLGRALQLTNILRDLDEDAAVGRLYLPYEALAAARIEAVHPAYVVSDPRVSVACLEVARRAKSHFDRAKSILATAPRPTARAPHLMAVAYGSLLDNMIARGFAPPRERARPSRIRVFGALLWDALR